MKVAYICGYYSTSTEKATGVKRVRTPPYFEAFMFCLAVKSGEYHRPFFIERDAGRLDINQDNFNLVRPTFGEWAARKIADISTDPLLIVPVPSKDAIPGQATYRSLGMAQQAFAGTDYAASVFDGLHWTEKVQPAHDGGPRSRGEYLPLLDVMPGVEGKNVVLVDDLVVTGASLLACADKLIAAGAAVLGAVTCGKSVYEQELPPFKPRTFELTEELSDVRG